MTGFYGWVGNTHFRQVRLAAVAIAATTCMSPARGDDASKFASGTGNILYLAAGVGLPLLEDGKNAKSHTARSLDALGVSVALSYGVKDIVRERRPGHGGPDSFPSGHATSAFAIATVESQFHPKQAPWWYLGATLIGASRLALHEHYWHDVIGGAALGYLTARLELSSRHGLVLQPWIDDRPRSAGVSIAGRF